MATASLTADLLARKGTALPTGKWQHRNGEILSSARRQVLNKVTKSKGGPIHKTLRLDKALNQQLKMLAARADVSQQVILEQAVRHYVTAELEEADCICGADVVPII